MLSAAMLGAAGCGATAAGFGASSPWLQALRSKVETETARVLRPIRDSLCMRICSRMILRYVSSRDARDIAERGSLPDGKARA